MKENDVIWVSIEESDKVGECAKFLGVKPYIINNALQKDNMGVFKFIVINDKIE